MKRSLGESWRLGKVIMTYRLDRRVMTGMHKCGGAERNGQARDDEVTPGKADVVDNNAH
jgi:hypothetical protein